MMSMTPKEFQKSLKGVFDLLLTPFDDENKMNEEALREQIDYVKKHNRGEDLVFLGGGSTAEFYAMNDAEYKRYVEIVVDEVAGEFPVLMGAGQAGTSYTIEKCKLAEEIGVDGVMIVNPYYHLCTQEGLYNHIKTIAKELKIGVVTYNNPYASKLWMPPELLLRLSKIENVVGNKENANNPMLIIKMMRMIDPEDMVIFNGLGFDMFQFVSMYGCPGYVTEMGAYAPELAQAIYKTGISRKPDAMEPLCVKVQKLFDFIGKIAASRGSIPSVGAPWVVANGHPIYQFVNKKALDLVGLTGGRTRAPMEDNLSEAEVDELRSILKIMGCKVVR